MTASRIALSALVEQLSDNDIIRHSDASDDSSFCVNIDQSESSAESRGVVYTRSDNPEWIME